MSKDQNLTNNQNVEIVDKLIKKFNKLKIEIDKLNKWLKNPLEKPYLSNKQYMLVYAQYNIMQSLRVILKLRIQDLQNERNKSK